MKKHVKIYMDAFDYGEQDFIPCINNCGRAVDIHHLSSRGMGGSKNKDFIENLVAVCRSCHERAHADTTFNEKLKLKHITELTKKGILFK